MAENKSDILQGTLDLMVLNWDRMSGVIQRLLRPYAVKWK
jgi:hypothetical protein